VYYDNILRQQDQTVTSFWTLMLHIWNLKNERPKLKPFCELIGLYINYHVSASESMQDASAEGAWQIDQIDQWSSYQRFTSDWMVTDNNDG